MPALLMSIRHHRRRRDRHGLLLALLLALITLLTIVHAQSPTSLTSSSYADPSCMFENKYWSILTPDEHLYAVSGIMYLFSLCNDRLAEDTALDGCRGASICRGAMEGQHNGGLGVATALIQNTATWTRVSSTVVTYLQYGSGQFCFNSYPRLSTITFVCDTGPARVLSFAETSSCVYAFTVSTILACQDVPALLSNSSSSSSSSSSTGLPAPDVSPCVYGGVDFARVSESNILMTGYVLPRHFLLMCSDRFGSVNEFRESNCTGGAVCRCGTLFGTDCNRTAVLADPSWWSTPTPTSVRFTQRVNSATCPSGVFTTHVVFECASYTPLFLSSNVSDCVDTLTMLTPLACQAASVTWRNHSEPMSSSSSSSAAVTVLPSSSVVPLLSSSAEPQPPPPDPTNDDGNGGGGMSSTLTFVVIVVVVGAGIGLFIGVIAFVMHVRRTRAMNLYLAGVIDTLDSGGAGGANGSTNRTGTFALDPTLDERLLAAHVASLSAATSAAFAASSSSASASYEPPSRGSSDGGEEPGAPSIEPHAHQHAHQHLHQHPHQHAIEMWSLGSGRARSS